MNSSPGVRPAHPVAPGKILFISHEASLTGAPMFLLHFLGWLKRETQQPFEILVRREGPLSAAFAALAPVHAPAYFEEVPSRLQAYALIYSNTSCNGFFLEGFALDGLGIITHVHELDSGIDTLGPRNFAEVVRHTDHFVACARAVAEQLTRRFRIDPVKISLHYEMFDPRQADANARLQTAEAIRQRFDLPPDSLVIAACGTVDLRKGADLFVQLAASLKKRWKGNRPLRFIWIGRSNEPAFKLTIEHDCRRLGLRDCLKFVGEQSNPHALLALSDVFCLTSREDPFPLVMLEAAALGKPLVCFDGAGGASELSGWGGAIGVPFLDISEMTASCLELLENEERRLSAGRVGAEIARSRFTPEVIAPGLWEEIRNFLPGLAAPVHPSSKRPSPLEVYRGWVPEEMPDPDYVRLTMQRLEAQENVRRLIQAGNVKEAGLTLIRAISAAMKSDDIRVLIEALIALSVDLAPLDPTKAATLLSEAERRLRAVPSTLEIARVCKRDLAAATAWMNRAESKTSRVA
jgi:glycosyltransferase involved in cell wall biosynthesis